MAISTLAPDILTAKQRRLHQLERQAAQLGYETPAHIATEIDDIKAEITASAPATVEESHPILLALIAETRADVRRLYWLLPICMLLYCILLTVLVKL